ncbi:dienelactone hydrolase family protein [Sphingomonas morindae]|uniref:Dienelactone hydrolase family protein n=1 Tax=Sphingomonas morindae TaxID=1541170 RepID=A0ABY4XCL7_9SPHN|nr:dienelactone hydrolase family protein [Sphingomonas morindae]USI74648.1 dienelactone hydrolase family protein [Sphingomonas morindae]
MTHARLHVRTDDGDCPCQLFAPAIGEGPWPAVIVYMDAGGIRPAIEQMSRRLADAGYVVLLPDLFYRYGPYGPFVPKQVFAGDFRAVLGPLVATTDNLKAAEDSGALLAMLDARGDVVGRRVGALGFCMGGGMAIAAAGRWPDRFAAVASFHGGRLATDAPTSPHLFAPMLEAELYVAAAEDDASYPPDMAERFEAALDAAGVRYRAETYPAAHGWMKPDFPVYDHAQAERGWRAMLDLFGRTLKGSADAAS